jgi:hypothetical protein
MRMPTVKELTQQTADSVNALLERRGYKFLKSKNVFFADGVDFSDSIFISCTRHHSLSFIFGRRFNSAAVVEARILKKRVSIYDRTILQNSDNIGPTRALNYHTKGSWFYDAAISQLIHLEMEDVLENVILPWLDKRSRHNSSEKWNLRFDRFAQRKSSSKSYRYRYCPE